MSFVICFLAALVLATQAQESTQYFLHIYTNTSEPQNPDGGCTLEASYVSDILPFTLGECNQTIDGTYSVLNSTEDPTNFTIYAGCDDTCTICSRLYSHVLDVCAPTADKNSAVLTQKNCTGGVGAQDTTTGLILNVLYEASCSTTFGGKLINLGTTTTCQAVGYIGNTYYYVAASTPTANNDVTISLCTDAVCGTCPSISQVVVPLYSCQETTFSALNSTYSWKLLKESDITSCEPGPAPAPAKSKLSTGAIAGIAAGSAVGYWSCCVGHIHGEGQVCSCWIFQH
jgi:hypothetical protein